MLNWMKAVVNRVRGRGQDTFSLISNWLANALWLIDSKFLSLAREAYGRNSVVYACLHLLSQSVAEAPLTPYEEDIKGERRVLDRNHELVMLINRPNSLMTQYEFWELTAIHLAVTGRSVWWKERDNKGQILALWPLRPDRVGPVYAASGDDDRVISAYSYQEPGTGQYMRVPCKDCLAFNFPDPAGESGGIVEGLGPIQVITAEISADNEATAFVGSLLANHAAPTVALKMKRQIRNQAEADMLKATFRAEFGGARRGTPAVLDAETEVQMLGFTMQQLEFPGVRTNTESRICAALGVPALLVGVNAGVQGARGLGGGGVAAQLRQYFTETTLAGYWRRLGDQYTQDIAMEFGDNIVCEFDTSNVIALAGRRQEALAPIEAGFTKGAVTRNEYRQALGLEAVEGGDVYLVPATIIEVPANPEAAEAVRAAARFLASQQRKEM